MQEARKQAASAWLFDLTACIQIGLATNELFQSGLQRSTLRDLPVQSTGRDRCTCSEVLRLGGQVPWVRKVAGVVLFQKAMLGREEVPP